jgi:transcriptional regulator with XRE-family HTH domain
MATPPKSPNPTDKHVGTRVKMRRLMLGMSKETLGNSLGVTLQQVQKYEDGKNRISASRLQHLARVLRVPESFFFEGGPNASSAVPDMPSYVTAFITNRDGVALARAFMSIRDGKLRRCITRLVEEIAKGH